jgi:hypothetical protein
MLGDVLLDTSCMSALVLMVFPFCSQLVLEMAGIKRYLHQAGRRISLLSGFALTQFGLKIRLGLTFHGTPKSLYFSSAPKKPITSSIIASFLP